MKKKILLCLSLFLLLGCATPRRAADAGGVAYHDLGPAPSAAVAPAIAASLEVRLPPWLDGQQVQYRLLYAEPTRIRDYALARWAAAPSSLLGERLRRSLGLTSTAGACRLMLRLDAFGQQFAGPDVSEVALRGDWSLFAADGRLLERRAVALSQSGGGDARSGVAGLAALSDRLAGEARGWLQGHRTACARSST